MSEYRLAYGTVDYTTLTTTDAYAVSNWPTYNAGRKWMIFTDGVISTYRNRTVAPSGAAYGLGLLRARWDTNATNRAQGEWFLDTYGQGKLVVPVTFMMWRFNNQSATGDGRNWTALTGLMSIDTSQTSENTQGVNDEWYKQFILTFTRCSILPEP